MMIHDITALAGKYKAKKRVGRGLGSGTGKTAARGYKGQKSRSGYSQKRAHEGGQMPYFRRMRKVGFSNFKFTTRFWIVNLRDIIDHPSFKSGGAVDTASMIKAGLIRDDSRDLKILGDMGERKLGVKLAVTAARVSDSVRKLVTDAGGSVNELGTRRDMVRGVDRNSDDRRPKNLGKKLKRGSKSKGKKAVAAAADAEAPKADAPKADAKPEKAPKADKPAKSE
jgi:large subunit ribosomal protein L15